MDYLLLLAMLLIAADLAYVESQFQWLGPNWAYHLLIVAIVYFAAAYRFDSRAVLTLALTSFAAWRGVEVGMPFLGRVAETGTPGLVRANAIGCGLLFLAAGAFTKRVGKKTHFEPVYVTGGLLLVLGALVNGAWDERTDWLLWLAALAASAIAVLTITYRLRRPLDFAIGIVALYLAGTRTIEETVRIRSSYLLTAAWSVLVLFVLIRSTRRMRRPA